MKVGDKTTKIPQTVGVKQGDNLGPILFITVINAVAQTLDDKWTFDKPPLRWHGTKENGDPRWNPDLAKGVKATTKGTAFTLYKSFYVDDGAFILLNRTDLESASSLIKQHFRRFGLTVHSGDTTAQAASKTEAMYFPPPGKSQQHGDTSDIKISDSEYFSFCQKFKYLGSYFEPSLDDTADITNRIQKASAAFAAMKRVLRNDQISCPLRLKAYETTVLNILLFGCESWALTREDIRKLETTHHRFLRSMLHITIYDVKNRRISNTKIRQQIGSHTLLQRMSLRRARWIEKIAHMPPTRNPRKVLNAWLPTPRPTGRPQQTIRTSYASMIKNELGLIDTRIQSWWYLAADPALWAEHVETALTLPSGTYTKYKHRMIGALNPTGTQATR